LLVSACGSSSQGEIGWARAALERNDRIEVVASDPRSGIFTVRVKDTGELRTVRADQIVGGPTTATAAPRAAARNPLSGAAPGASPETGPAAASASTDNATRASGSEAPAAGEPPHVAADETGEPAAPRLAAAAEPSPRGDSNADTFSGRVLRSGPGYTIA